MEKLATRILLCSFFIVLVLYPNPATSREVEDESGFNYEVGSDRGPDRWGELRDEWRMCKIGTMQSPIDLLNERVKVVSLPGRLKTDYKPSNATIKNRGHDIKLNWEGGAGSIEINGTQYELLQVHWHSPSEHTIDGRRFDLEAHMVHESSSGETAVVGILYTIGQPDSFLLKLTGHLAAIAYTREKERVVGIVNPEDLNIDSRMYYRYIGSLTTPPCTENVVWTIVGKVKTVTKEQVRLLRMAVHDESEGNARPLQPLNGRLVKLYKPRDPEDQN